MSVAVATKVTGGCSKIQKAYWVLFEGALAGSVINIEELCAAPPEAFAHSPSQMPLSCPVAPPSRRELHKDGGGGDGGVARMAQGARRPGSEGRVLRRVLWHVLRNALRRVLHVLVLHVSPKGRRRGGSRPGRHAPQHFWRLGSAA